MEWGRREGKGNEKMELKGVMYMYQFLTSNVNITHTKYMLIKNEKNSTEYQNDRIFMF